MLLRFYRTPALSSSAVGTIRRKTQERLGITIGELFSEWCFYCQVSSPFTASEYERLGWLLAETFAPEQFGRATFLNGMPTVIEIGPRLNFETAWSSASVAIFRACGILNVHRLERSVRYGFPVTLTSEQQASFVTANHDRMTQMRYEQPLESFVTGFAQQPVRVIPVLEQGKDALRSLNAELGLGMDEQDFQWDYDLFVNVLKRNPTDVELFDLSQANSEHSRHHFFKGKLVIDDVEMPESLMQIVKTPWRDNPANSLIAFRDDSSALRGSLLPVMVPVMPDRPSPFISSQATLHPTLTAETHNFPSGVAPFPGAETGTGGRIRDNQAVGRGGQVIAAGAAYCVGNLHIPGYELPWERDGWSHPENLASPLEILIQASNGASDYGNKFGEPVIYGFTRSFGMRVYGKYRSWFKPIMYTVGAGQLDDSHVTKGQPEKDMLVVQIGGPAYRIGLGGGSASSMTHGENVAELDFNAVQRGDAQMEQRVHRLIRACTELSDRNPIVSIHDLGAGGDCNAIPELVDPAGAKIKLRSIPVGDQSLSVLEIWGNESQERHALLMWPDRLDEVRAIAEREGVPVAVIGRVTGDGCINLFDEHDDSLPVNLPLEKVLGKLPQKTFKDKRVIHDPKRLELPNLTVRDALERVLRLVSVGSKRFLTTKVDRSVTGLIAQQQCVGPNHITLCDYAVYAQSHQSLRGVALSLGEQPVKGLYDPETMARMAVAEALLNMVGAKITALDHIKCSANWMCAAKFPGEGAWLYDAACALRDICIELGIAIDGGKDSLSMAAQARARNGRRCTVKAPGQLVIAAYAPMEDIRRKVTPEFKQPGNTVLFVDLAHGRARLNGTALSQVYQQVGWSAPDVDDVRSLKAAFETVQGLVDAGWICAVHDRSDGGLATTLLEMAFAGNVGMTVNVQSWEDAISTFFNEELGLVIECETPQKVLAAFRAKKVQAFEIGTLTAWQSGFQFFHNGKQVLAASFTELRQIWEETSSRLDALQANPACVKQETDVNALLVSSPPYRLSYDPAPTNPFLVTSLKKPLVAVIREQGSNGDREMAAAFFEAGFEPWDVTMTDLASGRITLDRFRGAAFVGGFSFADVMDSAKGWAGVIRFNERVADEFQRFYHRSDTFSLGVCNGCQLMALLGWVPDPNLPDVAKPRFIRNASERFESRFAAVRILESPSVMLSGMAGSILGIWVAHGEGRFHAQPDVLSQVVGQNLAPVRYVDRAGNPTMTYPHNPSGTLEGIAGVCSPDGRHLSIMPHPERTFLTWQWPWMPGEWQKLSASPWLRLFQNAYDWCIQSR